MRIYKMRVEFYDVDSMDVAWHGNYVRFLERARCEFLREIGYDYRAMKDDGYCYPIVKMDFKFIKPTFFGDEIGVGIEVEEIESFLRLRYTIFNEKGEKICKATTTQACVKIDGLQTQTCAPKRLKEAMGEFL